MIDQQVATATRDVQGGYSRHPRLEPREPRAAGPGGEPRRGHDRGAARALARVLPGGLDDERRSVEHDRVRPALRRGRPAEARGSRQLPHRLGRVGGRPPRRQPRHRRADVPADDGRPERFHRQAGQQGRRARPAHGPHPRAHRRGALAVGLLHRERRLLRGRRRTDAVRLRADLRPDRDRAAAGRRPRRLRRRRRRRRSSRTAPRRSRSPRSWTRGSR